MTTELGHPGGAVENKGLKTGALGLASATVVGVASTAPGYSLAASLGLVTAAVGLKAPALRGALIGATANKLLHHSDRPVLVVPALGED